MSRMRFARRSNETKNLNKKAIYTYNIDMPPTYSRRAFSFLLTIRNILFSGTYGCPLPGIRYGSKEKR